MIDGDTVECRDGERVRLLLIDAPEMDQGDFGPKAKTMLETLLPVGVVTTVEVDVQERDRYGRVLGYVYSPDDALVNEKLVRAGYAVVSVYPPNGTVRRAHSRRLRPVRADTGCGPALRSSACRRIIERDGVNDDG